jgi:hypothetical protein
MSDQSHSASDSMPGAAQRTIAEVLALLGLTVLLSGTVVEFHDIASGTGTWYADYSIKWFSALTVFAALCVAMLALALVKPWRRSCARSLLRVRSRLGGFRIVFVVIFSVLPLLVLQYTPWGVVFRGPYIRLLLWVLCMAGVAWSLCVDSISVWTLRSLLGAALLSASVLVVGAAFTYVTSYPFSLGWSEGNRLWDYSLAFGKSLYRFDPANEPIAYLDIGRQIIGGLPFLLPHVSIQVARLWLGVVATLPYMLVGLLAFFPRQRTRSNDWIVASLFALVFLSQGPIHPPLVVCAILVLVAWRSPTLAAAALMVAAGYLAESSRFTWMFAPAIWALMLELGGTMLHDQPIPAESWRRALALGASGILGSAVALSGVLPLTATSVGSSAAVSTSQALLWYRLLPNATYRDGILLGLLKAAGPLVVVVAFTWKEYGHRSRLQVLLIGASLLTFLIVGLVVSTKIGGGGDLHNLDMFLIGLLLTVAMLWQTAGDEWLDDLRAMPAWIQGATALCLFIPGYAALLSVHPLSFAADAEWISVLVGAERPRDLGSLPDETTYKSSLEEIRSAVSDAAADGPVLFMDQRQLLTFGYVSGVDLVPQYEKKRLMDEALSGNDAYFAPFYEDLSQKRFALIVSSPLRTPIKDSEYGFGEENNAWVQWVAKPVLCYYRELDTLNEVKVELLVPGDAGPACASSLPGGHP